MTKVASPYPNIRSLNDGAGILIPKPAPRKALADHRTFICLCKRWAYGVDYTAEEDSEPDWEDSDTEGDTDKAVERAQRPAPICDKGKTCLCFKPAPEHPAHGVYISKKGYGLGDQYRQEIEKRKQENFGRHLFNDFNGYGAVEVLENAVSRI